MSNDAEEVPLQPPPFADDDLLSNSRVTSHFYPQSGVDMFMLGAEMTCVVEDSVKCLHCGTDVKGPLRLFKKDDPVRCDTCLAARWFNREAAQCEMKDLPHLPLGIIFAFCPEYRDYARWGMVCKRWFNASNADTWAENDLTKTKRYLLSREIALQKERCIKLHGTNDGWKKNAALLRFVNRMQLSPLLGEWQHPATVPKRRLHLARWIVLSDFYAESVPMSDRQALRTTTDLKCTDTSLNVSKGEETLAVVLKDGAAVATYTTTNAKPVVVMLDKDSGFIASVVTSAKDKKCVVQ